MGYAGMKAHFPLVLLTFLLPMALYSQTEIQLEDWNHRRLQIQERQMYVLGAWAIGYITYSGIQMGRTEGEMRSFHQMNVAWNAANLGIAGLAWYGSRRQRGQSFTLTQSLREQGKIEKSLLFNAGLDIGYMAGGLYLMERGKNEAEPEQSERLQGFGKSIIVQGGFLFTYDIIFAIIQARHGNRGVMKWLESVQPVGMGLGIHIPIGGS